MRSRMARKRGLCPHVKNHPLGGWMFIHVLPLISQAFGCALLFYFSEKSIKALLAHLLAALGQCHDQTDGIVGNFGVFGVACLIIGGEDDFFLLL